MMVAAPVNPAFTDPAAPWFEREDFTPAGAVAEDAAFIELARRFRADGYLIHDFGFDDALLDACADASRRLPDGATRQQDLWRKNRAVRALAADPNVVAFLSRLYQRAAFPFQTLNFRRGSQQDTHSDTFFFSTAPERFMCGVWVALEDVGAENGPLHYYPGSHQLPLYTPDDLAASGAESYSAFVRAKLGEKGFEKRLGLLRRGEAVIWAANLFHGGEAIADPARSRLSQVNHYYFENCLYVTPVHSSAADGKLKVREPFDIAAGRFVRSRLGGRVVAPDLATAAKGRLRNLLKLCPAA